MKVLIPITVTYEVELDTWADAYGVEPGECHRDARENLTELTDWAMTEHCERIAAGATVQSVKVVRR